MPPGWAAVGWFAVGAPVVMPGSDVLVPLPGAPVVLDWANAAAGAAASNAARVVAVMRDVLFMILTCLCDV